MKKLLLILFTISLLASCPLWAADVGQTESLISGGPLYSILQLDGNYSDKYYDLWSSRKFFEIQEELKMDMETVDADFTENRIWMNNLLFFAYLEDGMCQSAIDLLNLHSSFEFGSTVPPDFYSSLAVARIYNCMGNTQKALLHLNQMVETADLNDNWQKFYLHEIQVYTYRSGSLYDLMEAAAKNALEVALELQHHPYFLSTYYYLGFVLAELRDYPQAVHYLQKGRELALDENNPDQIWRFMACEGICRIEMNDYHTGVELLESAGELGTELGRAFCGGNFAFLAKGLYMTGRVHEGLAEAEYAWASVQHSDNVRDRRNVLGALYDIYKADGQFERALEIGEKLTEHRNALFAKEYSNLVAEMETRYQVRESELVLAGKEHELAMEKARSTQIQSWIWIGFGLSAVLFGLVAVFYFFVRQRRKLAIELQQKYRELEALDKSKTRFFEDLSHEFRTPLTLIIGQLQELIEMEKRPQVSKRLQTALRNSDRLKDLITQILDVSHMESGHLPIKKEPVDPKCWFTQKLEGFESLVGTKGGTLSLKTDFPDNIHIEVDADKLEKILNNLMHNSFKFIGDNGKVEFYAAIEDAEPDIKYSKSGRAKLIFSVSDDGSGIPEIFADKLFSRKAKGALPSGTTSGYGIGLSLSAELIELMNGSISLDEEYKDGTKFNVVLPVDWAQVNTVQSVSSLSAESLGFKRRKRKLTQDSGLQTILIVEDHRATCEYLDEILRRKYRTICASNYSDAIDVLKKGKVDLVLSDVQMPGNSGYELVSQIRNNLPGCQSTPVVLLSGAATEVDKLKGFEAGADDYLLKPIRKNYLLSRLENLMSKSHSRVKPGFESCVADACSEDMEKLRIAESAIVENISNPDFSVGGLALQTGVSKRTLERLFKKHFKRSPTSFIRDKRLQIAWHLLEGGRCETVAEVRETVGIFNPSYFSRAFKQKFGNSPSEMLQNRDSKVSV